MEEGNAPKTGTTIFAAKFKGGIVIGADMKVSTGVYVVNRFYSKISQLGDKTFSALSGSLADMQAVVNYTKFYLDLIKHQIGSKNIPVKMTANVVKKIMYNNKNQLYGGMIIAGFDALKEEPEIYTVFLGGSIIEQNCAMAGSGSIYLHGYVDSNYKKDMTAEECENFILKGISHAIARDGYSGGGVRLVTVTTDGNVKKTFDYKDLPYQVNADQFCD